jgi:hypothetical protein
MPVTEEQIDLAVTDYIAKMEAGDPGWKAAEEYATLLIERKHAEEEWL